MTLLDRRTVATLFLAVAAIAAIAMARPREQFGMDAGRFWYEKSKWRESASFVIAGDSRAYRGISPAALHQHLPQHRIKNFGFPGLGMSPGYLDALEGVLDPKAEQRVVLITVTPHSLTADAVRSNGFVNISDLATPSRSPAWSRILEATSPMKPGFLIRLVTGAQTPRLLREEFFPDGWVAMERTPRSKSGLRRYARIFEGDRVDPEIEQLLLDFIQRLVTSGTKVFVVRPPVSRAMAELEAEMSGFDEERFFQRVERVNGWPIRFRQEFETYDGHHLNRASAVEFSQFLGEILAASLEAEP